MRTTPIDELLIGAQMQALATMFEGTADGNLGIRYQAVIGWHERQVGELCRRIDAADADGVFAIFDPAAIERGPVHVGVCIRAGDTVRLEIGDLARVEDGRTALMTRDNRSHLIVEHGRFVERPGKPAPSVDWDVMTVR